MTHTITASMLYDLIRCPHRVALDLYGDPGKRDPVSGFVKLLWEKGTAFEEEVIDGLEVSYTDLSSLHEEVKQAATFKAMGRGDALIYQGQIGSAGLMGRPDLLRKTGDGYVAGDIKSGAGLEGVSDLEEGRPKKHYAVQLALYTDILNRIGLASDEAPFVWDVHGREIRYDLNAHQSARNPETLWEVYSNTLEIARAIVEKKEKTLAAHASECKHCHWYSFCKSEVKRSQDLTLIPGLGRSRRNIMMDHIRNIQEMAQCDLEEYIRGDKTIFHRIGPSTLTKFQRRAQLLLNPDAKPYATEPITFPKTDKALFYDVETDPFRDICYLHGFIEQVNGNTDTERYVPFFAQAPTPEEEKKAFREAWAYIQDSQPCVLYYYSPYEKTTLRKLQSKYPDVAEEAAIEALFDSENTIDLYNDIVTQKTEWPTNDYSIKTLATYLGFKWRDEDPSGASSIEWYHRWIESGEKKIKKRILMYNEDDCRAMRVLVEGMRKL